MFRSQWQQHLWWWCQSQTRTDFKSNARRRRLIKVCEIGIDQQNSIGSSCLSHSFYLKPVSDTDFIFSREFWHLLLKRFDKNQWNWCLPPQMIGILLAHINIYRPIIFMANFCFCWRVAKPKCNWKTSINRRHLTCHKCIAAVGVFFLVFWFCMRCHSKMCNCCTCFIAICSLLEEYVRSSLIPFFNAFGTISMEHFLYIQGSFIFGLFLIRHYLSDYISIHPTCWA